MQPITLTAEQARQLEEIRNALLVLGNSGLEPYSDQIVITSDSVLGIESRLHDWMRGIGIPEYIEVPDAA
jgi:hypothetical protein